MQFQDNTVRYLGEYFDRCVHGHSLGILRTFSANCDEEFLRLFLEVAVAVAKADGHIDDMETEQLRRVARNLGIDPDSCFGNTWSHYRETFNTQAWWAVLGVLADASFAEVMFAYRKLAMQFHPDLWGQSSSSEKATAYERMKAVNSAFEKAKRVVEVRERGRPAQRSERSHGPAQSKPKSAPHKRSGPGPRPGQSDRPHRTAQSPSSDRSKTARVPTGKTTPHPAKTSNDTDMFLPIALAVGGVFVVAILLVVAATGPSIESGGHISDQSSDIGPIRRQSPANNDIPSSDEETGGPLGSDRSSDIGPIRRQSPVRNNNRSSLHLKGTPLDLELAKHYLDAGFAEQRQGRLEDAITSYNRAIELNPRFAQAYHNRADVYHRKGELRQAIAGYSTAIAIDPNHISAHNDRAVTYYKLGEVDRAIAGFKTVLSIDPDHRNARDNLKKVSRKSSQPQPQIDDRPGGAKTRSIEQALKYYEKRAAEKSRVGQDLP